MPCEGFHYLLTTENDEGVLEYVDEQLFLNSQQQDGYCVI